MTYKLLIPLVVLSMLYGQSVEAQQICEERMVMVKKLIGKYGETRKGYGLTKNTLIEQWSSVNGSWTILQTYPNGVACVVMVGGSWQVERGSLTPNGRVVK